MTLQRHGDGADARPARVLHLGKYFPPFKGGMESFLRDLMLEQRQRGLDTRALVHSDEQRFRSIETEWVAEGLTLPISRAARWLTLAFAPISPTYPLVLMRCIREQKPDVLHIHLPNLSPFWCLLLPTARHIPWVVHWHADVLASTHSRGLQALYWLYRPLEQAVLRRAARIIATSPPYLESSEPLATHRERCEVVPLGILGAPYWPEGSEGSDFTEASQVPADGNQHLNVLFVGRLTYYKGLQYLIEAVASVKGVNLRIVGDGEEANALVGNAEQSGAGARIQFLGGISDVALNGELADCDCVCLPSIERTEAFGVVLLEAMRAAKPVIATRVSGSGMSWLVADQETGLLVKPADSIDLANALERLRDDPDLRGRLGRSGHKRFTTSYVISQAERQIANIYQRLLATPP